MGWSNNVANIDRMNYADCVKALNSARNKDAGKPLSGGLRVFERSGYHAVRHHSTEIVRYFADGSIQVCTGWKTTSTLAAIYALTGKIVRNRALPLFNKRRAYPEKTFAVDDVVFEGVGGYLKFDAEGQIDRASVAPVSIQIIKCSKAATALRKRAKALAVQIDLRRKLGVPANRFHYERDWLQTNVSRSDEEVDYGKAPPPSQPVKLWSYVLRQFSRRHRDHSI